MNIKEEIIKTGKKLKQEFKEAERFDLSEQDKKFVDLVFESFSNPPDELITFIKQHPYVLEEISLIYLVHAFNKLERTIDLLGLLSLLEEYYVYPHFESNRINMQDKYLKEIDSGHLSKLAPQYWKLLTSEEQKDYQDHIDRIKTKYYEEFDTVRDRLVFLLTSLNYYYQTICEVRYADMEKEKEKEQ